MCLVTIHKFDSMFTEKRTIISMFFKGQNFDKWNMRTDLNPDSYGGSDPDLVFFEGVDSDQDTVRPFKICMVLFYKQGAAARPNKLRNSRFTHK